MLPFLSTSTSSATPTIRWTNQQITLSKHAPSRDHALDRDLDDWLQRLMLGDSSHPYPIPPLAYEAMHVRVDPDSPSEPPTPTVTPARPTYTTTPTVTPARSTSRTVHVARTPSKLPQSHVSSGISPLPSCMSSGTPPLPLRTPLGASLASLPTRSTKRSVPLVSSSSQSGSMYSIPKELLLPFGPNTHTTLEELGYSDTLHNTCHEVFNSCVPDRWASELAKRGNISSKPEALQISAAMWEDWNMLGGTIWLVVLAEAIDVTWKSFTLARPYGEGTETLIVTVRSSSNMLPKVHLMSDVVSHFVRTLLWEDPMKLGIKMESTVLAGLAPRNVLSMNYSDHKLAAKQGIRSSLNESLVKVTENTNATLEFVRYECMVQEHLVKLIGWCHNEWGNPSNLKGGVGPLEALAQAVSDKKCKFIRITRQEADEHMKRIEAGEVLTPNKVDQGPEESPIDDDNTYEGNDIGGSADQTDHLPLPTPSSPTTPTRNNDLGPAPHTSEITEDLIDPALLAPPIPNVSTPSPPLATTPSRSHMESRLPNTQLPIAQCATNRVPSKQKRKPTEKAVLYAASRKSRKLKRGVKSTAVVDSDEENEWEDMDNV
ncbi:uncharacterized protein EDB93DRAFT_1273625 [Suillus bovinus]|uniref:uncharacterized protein n=1 Tax=Suillus bovinus TaxID=48563 RepID=UPI001B862670|nr:uncharacterized protein EDB93DRAFT_1273625 [Suillus bovinus]KAG2152686.1 hypothetical protein EDB93DRAFT_1273625 [Suillus bovinus]